MSIKDVEVEIDGQKFKLYPEGKSGGKLVEYQYERRGTVKINVVYSWAGEKPQTIQMRVTVGNFDQRFPAVVKPGDNTLTYTVPVTSMPPDQRTTIAVAAYVPEEGEFRYEHPFYAAYFTPKIPPRPAKVELTKIEHAPTKPLTTQKIQVIAYLRNPGTSDAKDTLILEVLKGGQIIKTEELPVEVKALGSHIVEFPNFTLDAGTYDFRVTVKGTGQSMTISNVKVVEPWADIRVNKVTPEKTLYQPGERIRLTAEIQNYGTKSGRQSFNVTVDGKLDHTIEVTVREGHILRQPISVRISEPGIHTICVDDKCTAVTIAGAGVGVGVGAGAGVPTETAPTPTKEIIPPTGAKVAQVTLDKVRVKTERGSYIVYVKVNAIEIPVAYTNRKLTSIVPIPMTDALKMIGYDVGKITDVDVYKSLYSYVSNIRPTIQDEIIKIKGVTAVGVKFDGETKVFSTSKVQYFLDQIQDRLLIDLVTPEKFAPGIVEVARPPPRYIPIERELTPVVGLPPVTKREEITKPVEEVTKPAEEITEKIEEEVKRAEEEMAKAPLKQVPSDVIKSVDEAISLVKSAASIVDQINSRITSCSTAGAPVSDINTLRSTAANLTATALNVLYSARSVVAALASPLGVTIPTVRSLSDVYTLEITWESLKSVIVKGIPTTAPLPSAISTTRLNTLRSAIKSAGEVLSRITCAGAKTLPYEFTSTVEDALRALKSAAQTIQAARDKISRCQAAGFDVRELKSRLTTLERAYNTLFNDVYTRLSTLGSVLNISVPNTLSGLETAFNDIKKKVALIGIFPQNVPSPIPRSRIVDVVTATRDTQILVDRTRCEVTLGRATLELFKPPMSNTLYAMVTVKTNTGLPIANADVTVYWSVCPILMGGCETTISGLRARGKRKSVTTNRLGYAIIPLESYFNIFAQQVYAFAEVRYRGAVTQTPVVRAGGTLTPTAPSYTSIALLREGGERRLLSELGYPG